MLIRGTLEPSALSTAEFWSDLSFVLGSAAEVAILALVDVDEASAE